MGTVLTAEICVFFLNAPLAKGDAKAYWHSPRGRPPGPGWHVQNIFVANT
ncbi:DNA-directed RNA polymerase beta subunit [Parvularcula bermudensis HTCC2503]|uniref:DNA-directed RNA polymerase beta subunit n=1 Tax=Parvularcula bermudensis (strain ATCC BAA-594 / HTCC2503 / KCTC 12087) TaxID=314260 RepID=E0TDA8_PARBH|nr:DNA-directed RNA polymerase beta subunit [Parvularcula bermudensis HTCC2503]